MTWLSRSTRRSTRIRTELAYALAEHRGRAEDLLTIAAALESRLSGTKAALRDGIIRLDKAWIIACATALLDPDEAGKAKAMVLGRAGRLTPGGLRAAIARAVMDVAPRRPGSGGRKRPGTPGCSSGPRTPGTPR